jgi:hypothetical protein
MEIDHRNTGCLRTCERHGIKGEEEKFKKN